MRFLHYLCYIDEYVGRKAMPFRAHRWNTINHTLFLKHCQKTHGEKSIHLPDFVAKQNILNFVTALMWRQIQISISGCFVFCRVSLLNLLLLLHHLSTTSNHLICCLNNVKAPRLYSQVHFLLNLVELCVGQSKDARYLVIALGYKGATYYCSLLTLNNENCPILVNSIYKRSYLWFSTILEDMLTFM